MNDRPHSTSTSPAIRLLRALGGVWVGLVLLGLLVIGLTVASVANRPLQRWLDTTETGVYGIWPLAMLWAALCVNIALATLFRVPFRADRLGAHLAHVGVLLLAAGAAWYVHEKVEGDVLVYRVGAESFQPVDFFYDRDVRALYVGAGDSTTTIQTPLTDLPLHRAADMLDLAAGSPGADVRVRVVAYRPRAQVGFYWRDGGALPHPGARVRFGLAGEQWVGTFTPAGSDVDLPEFRFVYRHDVTPDTLAALLGSAGAAHTLVVQGPHGFRREQAVVPGDRLDWSEIGYRVLVLSAAQAAGFLPNGAADPDADEVYLAFMPSPAATQPNDAPASTPADQQAFIRRLVSEADDQAWDLPLPAENAQAQPGRLIDEDLRISYAHRPRDAALADDRDTIVLATGPQVEPALLWFDPRGAVGRYKVALGAPIEVYQLGEGMGALTVTVEDLLTHAQLVGLLESPSPHGPEAGPAVEMEIACEGWSSRHWLPLSPYADLAEPHRVSTPAGVVELAFGRLRRPLGASLHVQSLEYQTYPGTGQPRDYICRMQVIEPDGRRREGVARLNEPLMVDDYRISQQNWDMANPHTPAYTGLGVASRPGISLVWLGCGLIGAAMPYAFYVKPLLRRRTRGQGGAA